MVKVPNPLAVLLHYDYRMLHISQVKHLVFHQARLIACFNYKKPF